MTSPLIFNFPTRRRTRVQLRLREPRIQDLLAPYLPIIRSLTSNRHETIFRAATSSLLWRPVARPKHRFADEVDQIPHTFTKSVYKRNFGPQGSLYRLACSLSVRPMIEAPRAIEPRCPYLNPDPKSDPETQRFRPEQPSIYDSIASK